MKTLSSCVSASLALLAYAFAPPSALGQNVPKKDLAINGPYYAQLVQMKDVVADVLPPPAYIIETYLTVLQIIDALDSGVSDGSLDATEERAISDFIAYGRALKVGSPGVFPGYVERIGQNSWRMIMPRPAFESVVDVMELVPAG